MKRIPFNRLIVKIQYLEADMKGGENMEIASDIVQIALNLVVIALLLQMRKGK